MPDIDVGTMLLPDAHVIAENVLGPKPAKRGMPTRVDLARAISAIQYQSSIKNIPSIQVTVEDPQWRFLDSGLWDTDENSLLDPIDLNYPEGSKYWWRLTILSPDDDTEQMTLTFLNRMAIPLMQLKGPVKADRAKMTRAQFLQMLTKKVSQYGGINFISRELTIKQPIAKATTPAGGSGGSGGSGSGGGGTPAPTYPIAPEAPSGTAAKVGQAVAGMLALPSDGGGSNPIRGSGRSSAGGKGLAGSLTMPSAGGGGSTPAPAPPSGSSVWWEVKASDEGSVGSGNGGSYDQPQGGWTELSTNSPCTGDTGSNPCDYSTLGQYFPSAGKLELDICRPGGPYKTIPQVDVGGGSSFGPTIGLTTNAQRLIGVSGGEMTVRIRRHDGQPMKLAPGYGTPVSGPTGGTTGSNPATGGGGSSTTKTVIEPYYFEVNPNETYLHAMTRLAQEVNWELFWDGPDLYYDDEQSLITDPIAVTFKRNDPWVVSWKGDWDVRQVMTQMPLTLICEMFGPPRPGQVVALESFGPFSTGSTASPKKRPGCWIVQDVTRSKSDFTSVFTLVQPDLPTLEPAPQVKTVTSSSTTPGGASGPAPGGAGFAHPFPDGWIPGVLDWGYDGTFKNRICAPFSGTIQYAAAQFSNWGGYVELRADNDFGLGSHTLYFAEGLAPAPGIVTGKHVSAGDVICVASASGGASQGVGAGTIEWGLAINAIGSNFVTDPYCSQLGDGSQAARDSVLAFVKWAYDALGVSPASTNTATAGSAGHSVTGSSVKLVNGAWQ